MSLPIVMTANSTSATIANTTPGPANRIPRSPPPKATPVRITPTVATVAPSAWRGVSDSPRNSTASTTVSPPYAATIPLTTEIGPIRSPVKYARYAPAPARPTSDPPMRTAGSDGNDTPSGQGQQPDQRGTDHLHPGGHPEAADDRLASAEKTSSVPHARAAPRPVRRPMGIGGA